VALLKDIAVECVGRSLSVRFAGHLLGKMGADVSYVGPDRATGPTPEFRYPWADDPPQTRASRPRGSRLRLTLTSGSATSGPDIVAALERGESVVYVESGLPGAAGADPVDLLTAHAGGYAKHLVWSTDDADRDPPRRGVADQTVLLTGAVAAFVVTALAASPASADGPLAVAISARDVVASLLLPELGDLNAGILSRDRAKLVGGSKVAGGLVGLLRTADGHVIISPREQHQWDRLMALVGDDDLAGDLRFATVDQRQRGWEDLQAILEDRWSLAQPSERVFDACQSRRVACFPVRTVAEMLDDPQLLERGFWTREGSVLEPGLPFRVVAVAPAQDR
jgi:crotonobetainyl-CoA:carnitine CoA-transferase CaiB-like acyl-CoA transferase